MPRVRRFFELEVDPAEVARVAAHVLVGLGASLRTVAEGFVSAVHGSYSSFNPRDVRKTVNVVVRGGDGRAVVEVEVDYTGYVVYSVVSSLAMILLALILLWQAGESLDYLSMFQRNPFIVLVEEPPWLLKFVLDVLGDADMSTVRALLEALKLGSAVVLMAGIVGLIYLAFVPGQVSAFADEVVSRIKGHVAVMSTTASVAGKEGKEKAVKAGREEAGGGKVYSVICSRRAGNVILCSISGRGLSTDAVRRALEFLGFNVVESSTGVLVGENAGSFLADRFPAKRMRVRAILLGDDRAEIVFETSVWVGFSENDCKEAETILMELLAEAR